MTETRWIIMNAGIKITQNAISRCIHGGRYGFSCIIYFLKFEMPVSGQK